MFAGFLVSWSSTISIAAIKPLPLTSPITRYFVFSLFNPNNSSAPLDLAFVAKLSLFVSSRAARAAAAPTGLPELVYPCPSIPKASLFFSIASDISPDIKVAPIGK